MLSLSHLLIVLLIVLLVFGAGRLPKIMNDIGKGVRSLREGLKSEDDAPPAPPAPPRQVTHTIGQEPVRMDEKTKAD